MGRVYEQICSAIDCGKTKFCLGGGRVVAGLAVWFQEQGTPAADVTNGLKLSPCVPELFPCLFLHFLLHSVMMVEAWLSWSKIFPFVFDVALEDQGVLVCF